MFVVIVVAAVVGPLLVVCYLIDRRDRKRRHSIAAPDVISRAARDARSDARAIDAMPSMVKDVSWMDAHRRKR
ncbi:MAG TPA: hypothetical protein VKB75_14110 [Jatrophihabitans sp.]|nr:hypothetical protein [Jatrophihabitans sp.]